MLFYFWLIEFLDNEKVQATVQSIFWSLLVAMSIMVPYLLAYHGR